MRKSLKRIAVVIACSSALHCVGTDAFARTNWQGEIMITAAPNAACANDGWSVGAHALATLLPANIDNNGPNSFIAFHFNRRNAYSLRVPGALAAGNAYTAVGVTSAGSNFTFSGSILAHNQVPAPANVTITTRFITVTGRISNWAGAVGCAITYQGAFVRRQ